MIYFERTFQSSNSIDFLIKILIEHGFKVTSKKNETQVSMEGASLLMMPWYGLSLGGNISKLEISKINHGILVKAKLTNLFITNSFLWLLIISLILKSESNDKLLITSMFTGFVFIVFFYVRWFNLKRLSFVI